MPPRSHVTVRSDFEHFLDGWDWSLFHLAQVTCFPPPDLLSLPSSCSSSSISLPPSSLFPLPLYTCIPRITSRLHPSFPLALLALTLGMLQTGQIPDMMLAPAISRVRNIGRRGSTVNDIVHEDLIRQEPEALIFSPLTFFQLNYLDVGSSADFDETSFHIDDSGRGLLLLPPLPGPLDFSQHSPLSSSSLSSSSSPSLSSLLPFASSPHWSL
eukprot:561940-Hanusia_phi.AAC.5